jgi:hypothetical protein
MKVPYMDLTGQVKFGDEKQVTPTEFHGYFSPKQEETDVSGNGSDISTDYDSRADLEAEQTADMHELRQREQVRELFRDLLNSLRLRGIPTEIWADEIENRLSVYEFWREV